MEQFCPLNIPKCRPPIKIDKNINISCRCIIPRCRPPIRIDKNIDINSQCIIQKRKPDITNFNNSNYNNNIKDNNNNMEDTNSSYTEESNNDISDDEIDQDQFEDRKFNKESLSSRNTSLSSNNDEIRKDIRYLHRSRSTSKVINLIRLNKYKPTFINKEDDTNDNINIKRLIIFIAIIATICVIYVNGDSEQGTTNIIIKNKIIHDFRLSMNNVKSKFQNQIPCTWNAFQSQVEDVINDYSKVSIIVLFGNETNTIKCLTHCLGDVTSKVLGSNDYLILNPRNIGNEHGEIINKWKYEIAKKKIVIIEDLLNMNSEAIKAMHNLCEKDNPLVSKSVYIITIISNDYHGLHKNKFLEDTLIDKFSKSIDSDILDPIITRISDGPIVTVLSESNEKGKYNVDKCSFP